MDPPAPMLPSMRPMHNIARYPSNSILSLLCCFDLTKRSVLMGLLREIICIRSEGMVCRFFRYVRPVTGKMFEGPWHSVHISSDIPRDIIRQNRIFEGCSIGDVGFNE